MTCAPAIGAPDSNSLEEQERILILRAMEAAAGNQSEAARKLRIGRDAFRYKLKKYQLQPAHGSTAKLS